MNHTLVPPRHARRQYSPSDLQLAARMLVRLKQGQDLRQEKVDAARHTYAADKNLPPLSESQLDTIVDRILEDLDSPTP